MPCISGSYTPSVGPLIQVAILPARLHSSKGEGLADPKMYMALIDTGAQSTCISPRVAQEVGLPPISKGKMVGATGIQEKNIYQFGVGFITETVKQPTGQTTGRLHVVNVSGMEFSQHASNFDVLLGRDVICMGNLTMAFDGHFLLAF